MSTTPAIRGTTTRPVDEQFLDLVCDDAELLAAEFDAIVAAEWPDPPGALPGPRVGGGHPFGGAPRRATDSVRDMLARRRPPGVGGWARQRSPPASTVATDRTEGR